MDVATDCDWGFDWLDVGFQGEDLFCLGAEGFDLEFGEFFALVELGDPVVEVEIHWGRVGWGGGSEGGREGGEWIEWS